MKALLRKIRRILNDRRTRQTLARLISAASAVIVFVTTYALVLPAITLEKVAECGMEEHVHDDTCYEEKLICGLAESEDHHHDDSCYRSENILVCEKGEHIHADDCYDSAGNLICRIEQHTHGEKCYREEKTLICGQEESEGHRHTSACYEKVLICGKEAHTHSAKCYSEGGMKAPSDVEESAEAGNGSTGINVSDSAAGSSAGVNGSGSERNGFEGTADDGGTAGADAGVSNAAEGTRKIPVI